MAASPDIRPSLGSLSLRPSVRELVEAAYSHRRRVLLASSCAFALSVAIAVSVTPKYKAESSLLVLLGPEYASRPEAGNDNKLNAVLERDAFLRAETAILTSAPLEKRAMEMVGLDRIDPGLGHPGLIKRAIGAVSDRLRAAVGGSAPERTLSDVDREVGAFSANLIAAADKAGNLINVSFSHRDPVVAADVVNTLVGLYLDRRAELYEDRQAAAVASQADLLRTQLDQASQALAQFKADNDISHYETQRELLLRRRSDTSHELQEADSALSQATDGLASLQSDLARTPADVVLNTDTDLQRRIDNLKSSLQGLRIREVALNANYGADSRQLIEIRQQIRSAEADLAHLQSDQTPSLIRRGRNTVYDNLQIDEARGRQAEAVARARRTVAEQQLGEIDAALKQLDSNAVALAGLERQRDVLDETYRAALKSAQGRRVLEGVESTRTANVRVIDAAEPPVSRPNLRAAVLAGGVFFALTVGVLTAVLSELFRRGYISPAKIERDLGVPVLTTVREMTRPA